MDLTGVTGAVKEAETVLEPKLQADVVQDIKTVTDAVALDLAGLIKAENAIVDRIDGIIKVDLKAILDGLHELLDRINQAKAETVFTIPPRK